MLAVPLYLHVHINRIEYRTSSPRDVLSMYSPAAALLYIYQREPVWPSPVRL